MVACTSNVFESISNSGGTGGNCQTCYASFEDGYTFFKNLLIVVSSVATPLVLKALFTKMPPQKHPSQVNG